MAQLAWRRRTRPESLQRRDIRQEQQRSDTRISHRPSHGAHLFHAMAGMAGMAGMDGVSMIGRGSCHGGGSGAWHVSRRGNSQFVDGIESRLFPVLRYYTPATICKVKISRGGIGGRSMNEPRDRSALAIALSYVALPSQLDCSLKRDERLRPRPRLGAGRGR